MNTMNLTALGSLATEGAAPPASLGQQVEYLFAQQLLHAISESGGHGDEQGTNYLALLSDHLARQMADQGALGIGQQLGSEVQP